MNAQLRGPSATTNYVVFIPGSESGSEPKSRSMSTQSERVTRDLRIKTHQKNPLDTPRVSTGGLKGKKKDSKSQSYGPKRYFLSFDH